ncbi:MAG: manganese-dependent inorganic pyrophosphatase [Minisyncoccia bacterium]
MEIIIIGHKNPDTDSVVSALAYARFKNQLDKGNHYKAAASGLLNNESKFVLDYFKVANPLIIQNLEEWKGKIILLDHTEISQSPEGLNTDEIIEILDHHRLGGLQTANQIFARIEPLGATSTIVAKIFKEKGIMPDQQTAQLLIAGIISDTLFLQGPTTTDEDRLVLEELNKIAQIDNLEDFANKMFEAKSDLSGVPIEQILMKDYKEFVFGSRRVGIGACETIRPESVVQLKKELLEELKKLKEKNSLDLVYFMITDILNKKSQMIILGDEEQKVAEAVFGGKTQENILDIGNIISRKKEVVPPLEKFLK